MSASPGVARSCPVCGENADAGSRFCEACGAVLDDSTQPAPTAGDAAASAPAAVEASGGAAVPDDVPTAAVSLAPGGARVLATDASLAPDGAPVVAPCQVCGGEVGADGYCLVCGAKAPVARDHVVERALTWVGAVTDRGARRRRNEDAFALAGQDGPPRRAVLVVCDGVSSARDSDVASLAAARAGAQVLAAPGPQGMGVATAQAAVLESRLRAAADASNRAVVAAVSPENADSPPSCTWVAVVIEPGRVVAASVGDSRAYWVPDDGDATLLTTDDSWAAELIAAGMPRAQAEAGPHAHAITRWLGADAPDHTPRTTTLEPAGPGWALACSDGLWNYVSEPVALGALVRERAGITGGDPAALAADLVEWAIEQGGHDNITVALARVDEA
jgi:serine/threonine protein phosphatase PrpC